MFMFGSVGDCLEEPRNAEWDHPVYKNECGARRIRERAHGVPGPGVEKKPEGEGQFWQGNVTDNRRQNRGWGKHPPGALARSMPTGIVLEL